MVSVRENKTGEWWRLPVLAAAAIFVSTSCGVLAMRKFVETYRAPNYFPIHENPRIGDFVIMGTTDSERRSFIKVASIGRAGIHVCTGPVLTTYPRDITPVYSRYYLEKDGKVKFAGIADSCTAREWTRLKIAKPGDVGYIEPDSRISNPLMIQEKVTTPAGAFIVRDFRVEQRKFESLFAEQSFTCTSLDHSKVKFLSVARRCVRAEKAPVKDVIKLLSKITTMASLSTQDRISRMLLSMLRGGRSDGNLEYEAFLVKQGNGDFGPEYSRR